MRARARLALAMDYAEALWGQAEGWAAAFVIEHVGAGVAPIKSQLYAQWPQQQQAMLGDLIRWSHTSDIFVAPLLRTTEARNNRNAIAGQHLYCDLDLPPAERTKDQRTLLASLLEHEGSFAVASGSPGRAHVYVRLEEAPSLPDLLAMNRRLAKGLGGEKFEAAALLRLPGTLNHKRVASGGNPTLVEFTDEP